MVGAARELEDGSQNYNNNGRNGVGGGVGGGGGEGRREGGTSGGQDQNYKAVFRSNAAELYSWAKAIVSTEQGGGERGG